MKHFSSLILFCLLGSLPAQARSVVDFSSLWQQVKINSPSLAASDHRLKASDLEKNRVALLWLPALSLEGRVFSTNESALNFSSILGERSFNAADFNISSLNRPGFNSFQTLSLGLDFPLYDGGMRSSSVSRASSTSEAASYAQSYQLLAAYVETGSSYARVASMIQAEQRLKSMSEKVKRLLSHYSIGNKSNLIGYSGLLGIKGLINRIESVRNELQAESEAEISSLSLQARIPSDWNPALESTENFLERIMPLSNSSDAKESLTVRAAHAQAEAAKSDEQARRSQALPHLGLFANESITHGSRDTASGFTGGIYLKWALFNPAQSGVVLAANEHQRAEASEVEQAQLNAQSQQEKNSKKELALRQNLKLLEESESYLEAQTGAITKLFQNGSVTALQLAEVLNRAVDLVLQLKDLHSGLIQHRAQQKLLEAESRAFNE